MEPKTSILMPSLLALILAGAVFLRGDFSWRSGRPRYEAECFCTALRSEEPLQRVPTRLWGDPLLAPYVDGLLPTSAFGQTRRLSEVLERLRKSEEPEKPEESKKPPPRVVAVLVNGGDQEEDRETRLRAREALHSALACAWNPPGKPGGEKTDRAAYEPVDSEHLGYIRHDGPWSWDRDGPPAARIIPFEVFRPFRAPPPSECSAPVVGQPPQPPDLPQIVVLWIDEATLGKHPRRTLAADLEPWWRVEDKAFPAPVVIGPTSSDALNRFLEPDKSEPEATATLLDECHWYSPWATLALRETEGCRARLANFHRTIGDDEELARLLADEVNGRLKAWQRVDGKQIVLLVEWDTAYGRKLYRLLREHLSSGKGESPRAFRFSRGMDGIGPGAPPDAHAPDAAEAASPPSRGLSRLDHIARLRDRLADGRKPIRAIGILGTDVYDKLLLLRALKPRYPHAVFFTTDLDARLLDPAETEVTRNLLVASHYGLELGRDLQGSALPFRSGYQTSMHVASLWAVAGTEPFPDLKLHAEMTLAPARIYELARSGPYDLTNRSGECPTPSVGDWAHPEGPREQAPAIDPWWVYLALIGILFVITLALLWTVARGGPVDWDRVRTWTLAAGVAVFVVVAVIAWRDAYYDPEGEPLAFADGISVWPTCILRIALVWLSAHFILGIRAALRHVDTTLCSEYPLPILPEGSRPPRWRPLLGLGWAAPEADPALGVWQACCRRDARGVVWPRVVFFTALYALALPALFFVLGWPIPPTRGSTAFHVHAATLWPSFLAMILLNVMVFDAASLQITLMTRLQAGKRVWDERLREAAAEKLGIPAEDTGPWLTYSLLNRRAETVESFVYFPFVALLVMLVIHHPVFDNFAVPVSVYVVYGLCFGCTIVVGLLLSRAITQMRARVVADLTAAADRLSTPPKRRQRMAVERLKAEVEKEQGSRLGRLLDNPTLRALLIPGGGYGLMTLLQSYTS